MVISPHSIINQPILAMTKPGVLPIMAYAGRLRPKGVSILGVKYMKGQGIIVEVYERSRNLLFRSVQRSKRAYRCIFR